jgi:hypothetical protein
MPLIQLQRPWDSQPQESVGVAWDNPLASTITTLIPFGGDNRDIVTGRALTRFSGGSVGVDGRGLSLRGNGSAAAASIPLDLSAFSRLSVSFWLFWDTFANDDDFAFEFTPSTNTNSGFAVNPNSSAPAAGQFSFVSGGSAGAASRSAVRPSENEWHHYVVNIDRLEIGSAAIQSVFIDGASVALTNRASFGSSTNFANSTLYLFSRNNAALFGAGRIQNLAIRGGYLMSADEARQEYDDPWQLFAPLSAPQWIGGGSPPAAVRVGASVTAAFTVRSFAQRSQASAFSVRNFAGSSQAAAFTIRNFATASQAAAFSVLAPAGIVSASQSSAFTVRSFATATRPAAFSVRSFSTASQASAFSVRSFATTNQPAAFSVRNFAGRSQGSAYSIRNFVTASRAGAFSVEAQAGFASASVTSAFSVRGFSSRAQPSAFSVRSLVSATQPGAFSVRTLVAAASAGAWTVRGYAGGGQAGAFTVRRFASASRSGAFSVEFDLSAIVWPGFVPAAHRSVVTYTGHRSAVTYTGHRSVVPLKATP